MISQKTTVVPGSPEILPVGSISAYTKKTVSTRIFSPNKASNAERVPPGDVHSETSSSRTRVTIMTPRRMTPRRQTRSSTPCDSSSEQTLRSSSYPSAGCLCGNRLYLRRASSIVLLVRIKLTFRTPRVRSLQLYCEIKIQSMMDHPHIVTLNNTFQDDQNIYLCLEECAGGVSHLASRVHTQRQRN